jgi:hypothetical protein
LGERHVRNVEVGGSNPLPSTIFPFNLSITFSFAKSVNKTSGTIRPPLVVVGEMGSHKRKRMGGYNAI